MSVNLGTAYAELTLKKDSFDKGLTEAETKLTSFQTQLNVVSSGFTGVGTAMGKAGGMLTKTVTTPIVGIGAAAVKTTTEFDTSMSKVQALSGATGEDFDALRAKALEMGSKTSFTASEAADALGYMALAGWDTDQMLSGLGGVMNLAAAGGSDLATTSDIVTDSLSAFGYEAKDSAHFADVLSTAMSKSNTSTEQLGEAFKYVGPVAGALGYSIEDTSIAMGLMANVGVKGSQAGTSLRQALNQLIKPTKQSESAMKQYNIEMTNADGSMKSLGEVMNMLRENLGGLTEAEQAKAASMLFGTRAMSGMLGIINASDEDYQKLTAAIYSADGASQQMADTMLNNLGGQITILKSAIEGLLIQLGDLLVPIIKQIVAKIQELVTWLSSLSTEQKEQIIKWAAIVAAIGPALLIFGKLLTSIGSLLSTGSKLITWIGKAAKAFGVLGGSGASALGSIVAAAGPILAIIAVLVALGVALKKLYDRNGAFKESVDKLVSVIKNSLIKWLDKLKTAFNDLKEKLQPAIDLLKNSFDVGAIDSAMSGVVTAITNMWQTLEPIIDGIIDFTINFLQVMFMPIISGVIGLINGVGKALAPLLSALSSAIQVVTSIFGIISGLITGLITGDFSKLKASTTQLINGLKGVWSGLFNAITGFISGFWTGVFTTLDSFTGGLLTKIGEFIKSIFEAVKKFFTKDVPEAFTTFVTDTLPKFIDKVKEFFQKLPYNLGLAIGKAIGKLIKWGTDMITWAQEEMPKVITNIITFFQNLPGKIWNWLGESFNKIVSWGSKMKKKSGEIGSNFVTTLVNWFKGLPDKIWTWIQKIPEKIAKIGEKMKQAGEKIMNSLWEGLKSIWNDIVGWFTGIGEAISGFFTGVVNGVKSVVGGSSGSDGSHAGGLAYVPYNGYVATLHEGERVLTRNEAQNYNSERGANYSFTFNSPKAIDPYEANSLFQDTVRRLEEGFV